MQLLNCHVARSNLLSTTNAAMGQLDASPVVPAVNTNRGNCYSLAPKEVIIACSQALQPSLLGHRPPTASPMTSPPPRPPPCLPPWSPGPPLLQSKAPCQLPPSSPCLPRPRPHLHHLPQSQRYASGFCQAQQPVALLVVQDLLNDASVAQYLLLCIPGWDARSALM